MARKSYRYQDVNTGKWHAEPRDLIWLRQPISFNRSQVELQCGHDGSYRKDGILTINTIHGRAKVIPIGHEFDQYFDDTCKFGMAKLL